MRLSRQWDYSNGWAPHQIMIWHGLLNYGFDDVVHRLAYRWLYTLTRNAADYNGALPEKVNVVERSLKAEAVEEQYGNIGTQPTPTTSGFGPTNASYLVGLTLLPQDLQIYLRHLVPPEWIFR